MYFVIRLVLGHFLEDLFGDGVFSFTFNEELVKLSWNTQTYENMIEEPLKEHETKVQY